MYTHLIESVIEGTNFQSEAPVVRVRFALRIVSNGQLLFKKLDLLQERVSLDRSRLQVAAEAGSFVDEASCKSFGSIQHLRVEQEQK